MSAEAYFTCIRGCRRGITGDQGLVVSAFLVGKYELHTAIPDQLFGSLWSMEHQNAILGCLLSVACVYGAILVPLHAIAEEESRYTHAQYH